jgi:prepilin-type processing-associated H-X9-DG protein
MAHLAGDRNVQGSRGDTSNCGVADISGVITLLDPTQDNPYWDSDIHVNNGNMVFMDGSAQRLSNAKLRDAMRTTGDPNLTNCSLKPR